MTANRRQATDAELTIGSIVYKGNGKVAYKVWRIDAGTYATIYSLQTLTSKSAPTSRGYRAAALTVEDAPAPAAAPVQGPAEQTGIEMLRELLSF